ncbi:MAG: hypothetical protein ACHQNA_00080 [Acidimicrobiales bacterium]
MIFAIVVIVLALIGARLLKHRTAEKDLRDPSRVLDLRFARGEIGASEYLRARHLLTFGTPPELSNPADRHRDAARS